jgi:hypothetical protein
MTESNAIPPPELKRVHEVMPGDEVITVPKNPFTSSTLYGLAILLITAAVKKWVPPMFQDQTVKAALELLGYAIGAGIVLYGRWKANRPLGFVEVKQTVIKLLILACLLTSSVGCTSMNLDQAKFAPTQTATIANDSYTTTMQLFIQAYKSGWVSKDFLQNKVDPVRQKVNKALDDLNAIASGGSGNGPLSDFTVAWNAFQKVYQDLLNLRAQITNPTPQPQPTTAPIDTEPWPIIVPTPSSLPAPNVE